MTRFAHTGNTASLTLQQLTRSGNFLEDSKGFRATAETLQATENSARIMSQPSAKMRVKISIPYTLTAMPIDERGKTLVDLPGEIRNQIYGELPPDKMRLEDMPRFSSTVSEAPITRWPHGLREDGLKTHTAFMAASKAVYHESAGFSYDFLRTTHDEVLLRIESAGWISFLHRHSNVAHDTAANFTAIKRVRKLHLAVSTGLLSDLVDFCDVQDAMFLVLSDNLRTAHSLESIHVIIYSEGPSTPRRQ